MLLNRLPRTAASFRLLRPSTSLVNHFACSQVSLHLRTTAAMTTLGDVAKDATVSEKRIKDAIMDDHVRILHAYDEIKAAIDDDGRARWQNNFVWELARHSVAEELVLYKKFEQYLGEKGKEMAKQDRAEHQQVRCSGTDGRGSCMVHGSPPIDGVV